MVQICILIIIISMHLNFNCVFLIIPTIVFYHDITNLLISQDFFRPMENPVLTS